MFKRCKIHSKNWWGQRKLFRQVSDINEITYEEALEKMKKGAILIDVRTRQEFLEKHIEGALQISYYEIGQKIEKAVPNKDKIIILYCQNGGRSAKAYSVFKKLGYSNIYNLKGGIEDI